MRTSSLPARSLLFLLIACGCGGSDGDNQSSGDAGDSSAGDLGSDAGDAPPVDSVAPDGDGGGELVHYTETRTPCTARNPLRSVHFGDLHVHTTLSFDAWTFDTRADPADAYRFARGETIYLPPLDSTGKPTRPVKLGKPLDFAAVTDHSEFLGEVSICITPGSTGYDSPSCKTYRAAGAAAFAEFGLKLTDATPARSFFCGVGGANCLSAAAKVWSDRTQKAAEGAYDRTGTCRFTSFVAYEWTGSTGGSNLHRNVIFRNANVPARPVSYMEEPTAQGLWAQLQKQCLDAGIGCDVLAIPHNSNLSNGNMFSLEYGGATTPEAQKAYATLRSKMEPLVEVMQHKGASECYAGSLFGPADELCGFEDARQGTKLCNGDGSGSGGAGKGGACIAKSDYVRYALADGLAERARLGINPFQLGFIGSTDTHNGTPGNTAEKDFPGHVGEQDDTPEKQITDSLVWYNPGGLAAVWAVENSRDALFEALRRRETYATSGVRISLRFFGGWAYGDLCKDPSLVQKGYDGGVPMGGVLPARPASGGSPIFVIQAQKDETALQQVQLVKGWIDSAGKPQTKVFQVAGDPKNGASVDPSTCKTSGPGSDGLCGTFTDPEFDAARPALYFVRVVENPTCRWSTYACNAMPSSSRPALCSDPKLPKTIQERAWSSPIWYLP